MNAHYAGTITEPVPTNLFEADLYSVAKRWHKRTVEEISRMCNLMEATADQRANAIRAYMAERQRHE